MLHLFGIVGTSTIGLRYVLFVPSRPFDEHAIPGCRTEYGEMIATTEILDTNDMGSGRYLGIDVTEHNRLVVYRIVAVTKTPLT